MVKVTIPLLPQQREFLRSKEKMVAIYSSRACGKSFVLVLLSLLKMMDGQHVIYGVQNLDAWDKGPRVHLERFLDIFGIRDAWNWNGSTFTGTLNTKYGAAKLYLTTYIRPDAARGATEISMLALDEFALSEPGILGIYAPCCRGRDLQGREIHPIIRLVSTPNMESMWQLMMVEHAKYNIHLIRAKLADNVFLTEEQKETMTAAIFDPKLRAQEIDGEIILDGGQTAVINLSDFTNILHPFHDDGIYAGLDMAHKGQRDGHVFCALQGNRLLALHEFGKCPHVEVAGWIKRFNEKHRISVLCMDLVFSEYVHEALRYSIPCEQISFAEKAPTEKDQQKYANIRAWGYFHMAQCTRDGLVWDQESEFIDKDIVSELKREVCNTHFLLDKRGRILIEDKDNIRARLGRSPDVGDAGMLACLRRPGLLSPTLKAHAEQERSQYRQDLEQIMSED